MWDLIVSVPDHCLSSYFTHKTGHTINPNDYLGVLIHKDASPMYFATGSIMKTRLYTIFHEKTAFF